jgi:hypothetical protein
MTDPHGLTDRILRRLANKSEPGRGLLFESATMAGSLAADIRHRHPEDVLQALERLRSEGLIEPFDRRKRTCDLILTEAGYARGTGVLGPTSAQQADPAPAAAHPDAGEPAADNPADDVVCVCRHPDGGGGVELDRSCPVHGQDAVVHGLPLNLDVSAEGRPGVVLETIRPGGHRVLNVDVTLTRTDYERLEAVAFLQGCSLGDVVRVAVLRHIGDHTGPRVDAILELRRAGL